MPELPEVETTRRGIEPHIKGKTVKAMVTRQRQLRWPISEELPTAIEGKKIVDVSRRGKYLLLRFSKGHLLIHLGMSGSLRILPAGTPPAKHDHVEWVLSNKKLMRFTDPRRFGAVLWTSENPEEHALLAHLGPEPLFDEFSAEYLFAKSRRRTITIKQLIMDSQIVVGVGNIYAAESLFMSGIRPTRKAGKITKAEANALVGNIKVVLQKAITMGGTTLRDFTGGDGKPGYFKQSLYVYGREGEACTQCGSILKLIKLNGRASVYCPKCQK